MVIQNHFPFRPITTRQYRPGLHRVGIIVNGVELACANFQLLPANKSTIYKPPK